MATKNADSEVMVAPDERKKLANARMREDSGSVSYPASDWLTSFLYLLMRDGVPVGKLNSIILEIATDDTAGDNIYTNGWLAQCAHHYAEVLRELGDSGVLIEVDEAEPAEQRRYREAPPHIQKKVQEILKNLVAEISAEPGSDWGNGLSKFNERLRVFLGPCEIKRDGPVVHITRSEPESDGIYLEMSLRF